MPPARVSAWVAVIQDLPGRIGKAHTFRDAPGALRAGWAPAVPATVAGLLLRPHGLTVRRGLAPFKRTSALIVRGRHHPFVDARGATGGIRIGRISIHSRENLRKIFPERSRTESSSEAPLAVGTLEVSIRCELPYHRATIRTMDQVS